MAIRKPPGTGLSPALRGPHTAPKLDGKANKPAGAKPSTKPAETPHSRDEVELRTKTKATASRSRTTTGLNRPEPTGKTKAVGVAPSATSIDLEGLQKMAATFSLEHEWDIGDPQEAATILQRFVQAEQEQVAKEIQALPALVQWEGLVDNSFEKVDLAMNALSAAVESDPDTLEKACRDLFLENKNELDLGGVVIRHPAVIHAVKVLRCAQNPLTNRESQIGHDVFRFRPQTEFSKADLTAALEGVHQENQEKYQNLGGWADNFTHRPANVRGSATILEDAMQSRSENGDLTIKWPKNNTRIVHNNPENRPFLHACELIAARHDPSSLKDPNDQFALKQVLDHVGGPDHLEFDGKSLTKIGRALGAQYAQEHERTLERLAALPDDNDSLALIARSTLQACSRDGSVDQSIPSLNHDVIADPSLTMAMRILAYRSDLPDYSVPGADDDVAKTYFAQYPDKPAYTAENITEIVNANRSYSKKQSLIKLSRLAHEYNLTVDMNQSVAENLTALDSQLTSRSRQYDTAESQLNWFTQSISDDREDRSSKPIRQNLINLLGEGTDQALDACRDGDWNTTRENLAQLQTTLRIIDDQYASEPIESLNLDQVVESLDTIAQEAQKAQEWSVLDYVYSILSLGVFAAVKSYSSQGSDKALARVSHIRGEIRELRGDPENEVSRLLTLRHTIETQIKPNIRDTRGQEFIEFFQNHLDAAIYQDMHDDLVENLTEKFSYLEKGGSSDKASFEVGAGWGVGPAAKISIGLKGSKGVSGGDDRRIREGTSFGLTIGASGQVGAASIGGKIGGSLGADVKLGKTFKNVEDFVEYHQDDMMQALLRGLPNLPSSLRDRDTLARARQVNSVSQAELDQFNVMARSMGVFQGTEGFAVKTLKAPMPTQTVTVSANAKISGSLGADQANVKGEASLQGVIKETTFYKEVNLLDYLKANLDDLDGVQPRSNPLEVSIRDFPENETIEAFNERIAALPDRQERIEAVLDAMARVAGEFGSYCNTTINYDNLKSPISLVYKSPLEKNLQRMKHEYQHNRGVRNREEYVGACLATHAHLLKALKDQCKPGEFESFDLKSFDDLYNMPKLPLSDKQLKVLRKELTKTGTAQSIGFELTSSLPVGMKVGANATICEIENNSNPDNDGVYLNIQLTGSNDSLTILPYLVDELQSLDAKTLASPSALAKATKTALKSAAAGKVASTVSTALIPGLEIGSETGATLELNFIKSHGLALQYARAVSTANFGGKVEDIPLGVTGLSGTVGASKSRSRQIGERIGTNTISYVVTQCNGFKLAGGDWKSDFRKWCTQDSNKDQVRQLALNMIQEKSIANLETLDTLEGLSKDDSALSNRLLESLKAIEDGKDKPLDDKHLAQFSDAFADVIVKSAGRGGLARSKLTKSGWTT